MFGKRWRDMLRGILRRDEVDRELAEEVEHFLSEAAAAEVARGADAQEANRRVRLTYGDAWTAREDVRASMLEGVLLDLSADLRLAARRLRRSPGFTTSVALILGLGIGAAVAVSSVVRPVLVESLPYPDADRIVAISDRSETGAEIPVAFGTFRELRERARSMESLAVHRAWQPTLVGTDGPERLIGQRASAEFFDVLGVPALRGRTPQPAADHPDGPREIVLSHPLWERRFGADPDVVGTLLELDGAAHLVVGVMPESFVDVTHPAAEIWAPLRYDPAPAGFETREWGLHLGMVGRVAVHADFDGARAELRSVARQPDAAHPRPEWARMEFGLGLTSLREAVTESARLTAWVLVGAAVLLLVITAVNLAILLFGRARRREEELAVRAALGARPGRLVRQLLTESVLLAGAGGVVGLVLGHWGLAALMRAAPATVQGVSPAAPDVLTVVGAAVMSATVGIFAGVSPALRRPEAPHVRGSAGSPGRRGFTRLLVAGEVALALVLLVGAGLLFRTVHTLHSLPAGFEPGEAFVMQIHATGLEGGDAALHRYWRDVLRSVAAVPAVRAAAVTNQLPLSGDGERYGIQRWQSEPMEGIEGGAYRYGVSAGYLDALGISVLAGRALTEADAAGAARVVLVSRSVADQLYPDGALGKRIRVGAEDVPFEVVGVVGDVTQQSLEESGAPAVYTTSEQWHWADRVKWLVLRGEGVSAAAAEIHRAVWAVDPDRPIARAQGMADVLERSEARRSFVLDVVGAFALVALTLAGLGLYGVMAGSVADRRHELGVRAALGATRENLLGMVVRRGMAVAALGIVVGVVLAVFASRLLTSLLFGVTGVDPLTYGVVAVGLAGVALAACAVPGIRAARMDPLNTLKAE